MSNDATHLIHIDELDKVFYTEEVETHALSDIEFDVNAGEFVSIAWLKQEMKRLFAEQKTADQNRKDEITDKLSEIEALIS